MFSTARSTGTNPTSNIKAVKGMGGQASQSKNALKRASR